MIVPDVNVTVYLYVEGACTPEARALFQHDSVWLVLPLWESEFLTVMWQYVRRGTFSRDEALRRFQAARKLVAVVEAPPAEHILRLAVTHDLTAYDATYAALGQWLGIPLVTYDQKVLAARQGIHPRDLLQDEGGTVGPARPS